MVITGWRRFSWSKVIICALMLGVVSVLVWANLREVEFFESDYVVRGRGWPFFYAYGWPLRFDGRLLFMNVVSCVLLVAAVGVVTFWATKRFRLHLPTFVLLSIAAGGLMWINTTSSGDPRGGALSYGWPAHAVTILSQDSPKAGMPKGWNWREREIIADAAAWFMILVSVGLAGELWVKWRAGGYRRHL